MIYCVIFDTKNRENNIKKKNDCRVLRQSILALPTNISEYVDEAKFPLAKAERLAAYSSLLCSLKCFFEIENPVILHESGKKPTIKSHEIFFNISHCDGVAVVTISDECEVGVDIQTEPDNNTKTRLEKRFLNDISFNRRDIDITYFLTERVDESFLYYEIEPKKARDCFSSKWAYMESCMKLFGDGFSALSRIPKISEKCIIDVIKIKIENIEFSIANSKKMVKM